MNSSPNGTDIFVEKYSNDGTANGRDSLERRVQQILTRMLPETFMYPDTLLMTLKGMQIRGMMISS